MGTSNSFPMGLLCRKGGSNNMKNGLKVLVLVLFCAFLMSCTQNINSGGHDNKMTISSSGIVGGIIEDKYGKRGTQFTENGMPNYSLPIKIENAPEGTKSFAIFLEDKDAIPVAGFSWIHWVAANIKVNELEENASLLRKNDFVQGRNSWSGSLRGDDALGVEESSMYGGMAPPDKEHTYELTVYALSEELNLENGFYANELFHAMEGKILGQATIKGKYKN